MLLIVGFINSKKGLFYDKEVLIQDDLNYALTSYGFCEIFTRIIISYTYICINFLLKTRPFIDWLKSCVKQAS